MTPYVSVRLPSIRFHRSDARSCLCGLSQSRILNLSCGSRTRLKSVPNVSPTFRRDPRMAALYSYSRIITATVRRRSFSRGCYRSACIGCRQCLFSIRASLAVKPFIPSVRTHRYSPLLLPFQGVPKLKCTSTSRRSSSTSSDNLEAIKSCGSHYALVRMNANLMVRDGIYWLRA